MYTTAQDGNLISIQKGKVDVAQFLLFRIVFWTLFVM